MNIEKDINQEFLIAELQKGEEKAFDFIFKKYYKALCAQAVTYVKDLDLAQSLVQECFIKLWEKREKALQIEKLSTYLVFMVRNRCIDYIRKTKKIDHLQSMTDMAEAESNSETAILSHEFEERLILALATMPERTRIAFEYSRFEGLTYKEIAQRMNITGKAVEALISRALILLRRELKDYLPLILLFYSQFK